jgi:hypothetical protein
VEIHIHAHISPRRYLSDHIPFQSVACSPTTSGLGHSSIHGIGAKLDVGLSEEEVSERPFSETPRAVVHWIFV